MPLSLTVLSIFFCGLSGVVALPNYSSAHVAGMARLYGLPVSMAFVVVSYCVSFLDMNLIFVSVLLLVLVGW